MFHSKLSFLSLALVAQNVILAAPTHNIVKRDPEISAALFNELHRAADLSSAAYSGCTGSAFDVTITLQLDNLGTDTQGYVGYSTTQNRISVVMRGSTSVTDFLNDLDTTPVTPSLSGVAFPSGVQVMNGVYQPWASVHDQVIAEVKSLIATYPTYTLESTGHSLGGSLTYLSYIALAQNFPSKSLQSNSLNAFPIGNAAFAAFGTAQTGTIRRGTNFGDGVPNMYATEFDHYGTEYYGDGTQATTVVCTGERDTSCSAGDGATTVTLGHLSSFGVTMETAGC